ncbi:MAG: sulfur oxidation c-type cytochrome SoxX [Zoogloeaceae bacterium]|jgi:sulfur-oxidizing protein SoxX|nr:sulfur oxidation c-type cytochrome SoxX [Zoogloeaceae bacterium]
MNAMKKTLICAAAALACSAALAEEIRDYRAAAVAMLKRDFKTRGIATADRVIEDGVQAICNRTADNPPKDIVARLEQDALESIRYPADGQFLGDWKEGEKIAQNGRGMAWSDPAGAPGGGSCYNCHQIGPQETSFGTIGTSLYQFGKLRGNTPETQRYVYGRLWNAKAFNLCSAMPRFGHSGALTDQQIRHLIALLLDPQSPVNSK